MKKHTTIFFALLLCCTGCNPIYYSPNTQNVPAITKKGEVLTTVSGNGNQYEFQAAYGLTDMLAGQVNGGLFRPKDLDNGNGGSGNFLEGGLGVYKVTESDLILETYGLVGFGSMENHFPTTTTTTSGDISADALRLGIQSSISYKRNNFSISGSTRLARLSYSEIEGDLRYAGEDQVPYLEENSSQLLLEPALTLRGGVDNVKLQFQIGYSLNLSDNDFRQDEAFLTLGARLSFPSR